MLPTSHACEGKIAAVCCLTEQVIYKDAQFEICMSVCLSICVEFVCMCVCVCVCVCVS